MGGHLKGQITKEIQEDLNKNLPVGLGVLKKSLYAVCAYVNSYGANIVSNKLT